MSDIHRAALDFLSFLHENSMAKTRALAAAMPGESNVQRAVITAQHNGKTPHFGRSACARHAPMCQELPSLKSSPMPDVYGVEFPAIPNRLR
ncbi:MAG: hypothetical protein ACYYK0_02030 [Candidatus Eutrophobiaceae bacterium]